MPVLDNFLKLQKYPAGGAPYAVTVVLKRVHPLNLTVMPCRFQNRGSFLSDRYKGGL